MRHGGVAGAIDEQNVVQTCLLLGHHRGDKAVDRVGHGLMQFREALILLRVDDPRDHVLAVSALTVLGGLGIQGPACRQIDQAGNHGGRPDVDHDAIEGFRGIARLQQDEFRFAIGAGECGRDTPVALAQ